MTNGFREKVDRIRGLLAAPCHDRMIRRSDYRVNPATEADLSRGCLLDISEEPLARDLGALPRDLDTFMSVAMAARPTLDAYRVRMARGTPAECPPDAAEAFELRVGTSSGEIIARDAAGMRRGVIFLEDLMTIARSPVLPLGTQTRWTRITDRITRSPIASYRWRSGWELLDDQDYYPEEYLNKLMHCGINGIWVAGLFRNLIRTSILPEVGPAANRLDKLKALVEKTARYGIKVYLFCIEPRSLDAGHPVFEAHSEIRGAIESCLCTSTSVVQEYIRQATCELFSEVPHLGGIINLFNGERITNCWLAEEYVVTCPRCRQRRQVDVLAEDLNCFAEGIRRSGAKGRCLAWTYKMAEDSLETLAIDPMLELVERTDPEIVWLGNFEHGGTKTMAGRQIPIDEYSLSFTGPSEPFVQLARRVKESGRTVFAKLQLGTTFELSTVPYLPVPGIVYDKFKAMHEQQVTGTMLNWIPGGFPSVMLKAAGEAAFCPQASKRQFLERLARLEWPEAAAGRVVEAWTQFEEGLQEYPFTNRLFYFGPITRAPAYPLALRTNPNHADPYNWGIDRDRVPQPFEEDLDRWLPPFTVREMLDQLDRVTAHWGRGLDALTQAVKISADGPSEQSHAVAEAIGIHFGCTRNVLEFLACRRALKTAGDGERKPWIERMERVVEDQIRRATAMKSCIDKEPAIGWQSEILDFSYDRLLLDQAIAMNEETRRILRGPETVLIEELAKSVALAAAKEYRPNVDADGD